MTTVMVQVVPAKKPTTAPDRDAMDVFIVYGQAVASYNDKIRMTP